MQVKQAVKRFLLLLKSPQAFHPLESSAVWGDVQNARKNYKFHENETFLKPFACFYNNQQERSEGLVYRF